LARPAWKAEIERRLGELEGQLNADRLHQQEMGVLDDEELQLHAERLDFLEAEVARWEGRIEALEKQRPRRGRPPRRRQKTAR